MRRKLSKYLFIILLMTILFTIFSNYYVENKYNMYITDDMSKLPKVRTGLVLGTSKKLKSGLDNYYFTYRMDAAEKLYKNGKIKYIIVSGDNGREEYNESEDMKLELIRRGIPEKVIFPDYAGFRTLDSVLRSKEVFQQDSIIFISQKFHNERAVFIARKNDMVAYGFNAEDVSKKIGFKVKVREVFARNKVFIDFLFGVEPKFYGDKINVE